jgi:AAA ATPase domain
VASINQIICQSINPFDIESLRPGNFWQEQQEKALTVDSIHREAATQIEELLERVATQHRSSTVLLLGDSGSGKSYLLGRIKRNLNPKAFFVYLDSWADSDFIWRHILRQTVDSLIQKPEGQEESQLLLWLKGLSVFQEGSFAKWMTSDRQRFINNLSAAFPAGIYNPKPFFGVLYDLTNPELYLLACQWLRGDDLDDDDLKALKVRRAVESEEAAKGLLENFGRIAASTQPIVLCFDNLDSVPRSPDGFLDLQALFNVNTSIHNQYLKNFLILISLITNTWQRNEKHIYQADLARIDAQIRLKSINTKQVEALWSMRLYSLHQKAQPKPKSSIYPLDLQQIDLRFPGGKTAPRNALIVGRELFQQFKNGLAIDPPPPPPDPLAAFKLVWQDEYKEIQSKYPKITLLPAQELIRMLQEALDALEVPDVKTKLLSGSYSSYSLSYKHPHTLKLIGVVWTEDPNMRSFYNIMNACQKVINTGKYQKLYLIRVASIGSFNLAEHKLYRKIFTGSLHHHIKENLSAVHFLATYHKLVSSARANDLVIAGKTIQLKELEVLIRQAGILDRCQLLQDLKIVSAPDRARREPDREDRELLDEVQYFLLNRIQTQGFMALKTIVENAIANFPNLGEEQIKKHIKLLVKEQKIKINNPKDSSEEQLVYWIPSSHQG